MTVSYLGSSGVANCRTDGADFLPIPTLYVGQHKKKLFCCPPPHAPIQQKNTYPIFETPEKGLLFYFQNTLFTFYFRGNYKGQKPFIGGPPCSDCPDDKRRCYENTCSKLRYFTVSKTFKINGNEINTSQTESPH